MPAISDVVVTGIGVVSPIGIGGAAVWQSIVDRRSGIGPLSQLDTSALPIPFGGEVREFDPKRYVRPVKSLKVMCRDIQLGVAAAQLALDQAGGSAIGCDPERFGAVFGADSIPVYPEDVAPAFRASTLEGRFSLRQWGTVGCGELNPLWMLKFLPNMTACHVAIAHDARGPNNTLLLGEVSSLMAIIEAARVIERGAADVMVCGGTGSRLQPVHFTRGFVDSVSRRDGDPAAASRPFDADRDGWVQGEGAAALVLESGARAAARGAPVLARLVGAGMAVAVGLPAPLDRARSGDARVTPLRGAIERALREAIASAGWNPSDVGHINAHGLATIDDDRAEAQAIEAVLGQVPVTAPKSYFGHTGAGGGAIELAVSLLALQHGAIPATLNHDCPDPGCPVEVVTGAPREPTRPTAVSLNHARTGQAVALAVSR